MTPPQRRRPPGRWYSRIGPNGPSGPAPSLGVKVAKYKVAYFNTGVHPRIAVFQRRKPEYEIGSSAEANCLMLNNGSTTEKDYSWSSPNTREECYGIILDPGPEFNEYGEVAP